MHNPAEANSLLETGMVSCQWPLDLDVAAATWTNSIGATELIALWKDPEFDPRQRALS
jgi:Protein of unknown function (DUF3604)